MKLNCKEMCEGWQSVSQDYEPWSDNRYPARYCFWCGAKLVDKEAELRDEFEVCVKGSLEPYGNIAVLCDRLFSKYNITKKE